MHTLALGLCLQLGIMGILTPNAIGGPCTPVVGGRSACSGASRGIPMSRAASTDPERAYAC